MRRVTRAWSTGGGVAAGGGATVGGRVGTGERAGGFGLSGVIGSTGAAGGRVGSGCAALVAGGAVAGGAVGGGVGARVGGASSGGGSGEPHAANASAAAKQPRAPARMSRRPRMQGDSNPSRKTGPCRFAKACPRHVGAGRRPNYAHVRRNGSCARDPEGTGRGPRRDRFRDRRAATGPCRSLR